MIRWFFKKDYVKHDGSVLPLPGMRRCGKSYKEDEFYVRSAETDARRLIDHFGCDEQSKILDVGCGQGRLAIGLIRAIGKVDYLGLDVDQPSIQWCKSHIQSRHPHYKFSHLNYQNQRYAKKGCIIDSDFKFPVPVNSIDIVQLFSVFTHMPESEMKIYLQEFIRLLRTDGNLLFTAFVAENVENCSVNPKNCGVTTNGSFHIVRYEKKYLLSIVKDFGFSLLHYEEESRNQELKHAFIYLKKEKSN